MSRDPIVESDSSSIASSATGSRVGTMTGYYPFIVLYNLLSNQQLLALRRTRPPCHLHPLKIPPTDLKEIRRAIGSSSHTAQLAEKDGGLAHAAADVMKQQVLMDPRVGQLEPASLQSCDQSLHVQQDRV